MRTLPSINLHTHTHTYTYIRRERASTWDHHHRHPQSHPHAARENRKLKLWLPNDVVALPGRFCDICDARRQLHSEEAKKKKKLGTKSYK